MIANKNEAKTSVKLVLCDFKCKFNSSFFNSDYK